MKRLFFILLCLLGYFAHGRVFAGDPLEYARGMERLAAGGAMLQEIKKGIHFLQEDAGKAPY